MCETLGPSEPFDCGGRDQSNPPTSSPHSAKLSAAQDSKNFLSMSLRWVGPRRGWCLSLQCQGDVDGSRRGGAIRSAVAVEPSQEQQNQKDHDQEEQRSTVEHEHLLSCFRLNERRRQRASA